MGNCIFIQCSSSDSYKKKEIQPENIEKADISIDTSQKKLPLSTMENIFGIRIPQ
jgi:hypothetical protein